MKPKIPLCLIATALAVPVCSAVPIFSWETGTEGWVANDSNSAAISTTGATDGLQSLAVTMPNGSMWWNAAATVNLTPEQLKATFGNATELKLDVTYPNPGDPWGDGWVEIIIQGANVGWTGIGGFAVPVDGTTHTLTFGLTVAQAAGMASGDWGQIIFRTAYGNGGPPEGTVTMYIDNLTNTVVADPPPATDLYWKGDVDDQWTSLNWTPDIDGIEAAEALPNDGSAGIAFATSGAANLTTLLGADQNVASIVVTGGAGPAAIGGTHGLTIGAGGIWLDESAGDLTIDTSGGVVLGADQEWKNKSTGTLIVDSALAGAGILAKSGAGPVRLGGANSHTGGTIVEQGVLALDHAEALGGPAASLAVNGGFLDLNGLDVTLGALEGLTGGVIHNTSLTPCTLTLDTVDDSAYACQIGDAPGGAPLSLVKKGIGALTSSGGGNFTGSVSIEDGLFVANTWVFNIPNWSSFGNCQVPGRTITVTTPGALSFTSNNIFGNAQADTSLLPDLVVNGATVHSTRYNQIGDITLNGGTLSQTSTDAGDFQGFQFMGNVTVTGSAESSIENSTGKANHLSGDTVFQVADVNGTSDIDLFVAVALADQSGDYGNAAGGLTKTGPGTMALDGFNTYSGATRILEGVLSMGLPSFSDSAAVEIASGAVLDLYHPETDTVGSLKIGPDILGEGTYGAVGSGAQFEREEITGDGMLAVVSDPYFAWIAGFTTLDGITAEKDQDPDHDGLTNLEEFGLDGNPEDGTATGKLRSRVEMIGGEEALVITLPVRDGAFFAGTAPAAATLSVEGITYEIGGSNDLANFDQNVSEVVPALTEAPAMPALNAGWTYRTFRLDGAVGGESPRGPKGFLKATVTGAP